MAKEDDLAIDFSAIGKKLSSVFGGKPGGKGAAKAHPEHHPQHASGAGNEGHHEAHAHGQHEGRKEEEVTIDIKAAWNFMVRNKTILLLLIPIIISIFFRSYTLYLPITDDWAQSSVQRYYQSQIMEQVNKQYPNLPAENKEAIVNENLQKLLAENKAMYEQQISQLSESFRQQFEDEKGDVYLMEIDTWHWYRYVDDIADHGFSGDVIRDDGLLWDKHMIAPLGSRVGKEFHPYLGAWLHNFLRIFNRDISTSSSFFLLPIVILTLSVIPAFFIGRKLGGDIGGLFAGILTTVHPSILSRTVGGFCDTDMHNVLFPLLIFWFFFEALDSEDKRSAIIYSLMASFTTAIYSMTWYGWWYIFNLLAGVTVIYMLYRYLVQKESLRELFDVSMEGAKGITFTVFAVFVVISPLLVALMTNTENVTDAFTQPISFITLKQSTSATLWPNVYTTVAELNEVSLSQIVDSLGGNSLGGRMLFFISIIGILLTFTLKKEGKMDVKYGLLFIIWFIGLIYASTKGIRFVTLLAPAFSITIGAAVGITFKHASSWAVKELNLNRIMANAVLFIVLALLLIGPLKGANTIARSEVPSVNDAMYGALTSIKTNSTQDAIINSWWDFGHWFKAIGDRAVTFDGATQNRPQAHWIGRVLLTSNEDEAVGILRMLDCGATLGFDRVNNITKNMHKSIDLVYRIVVLDKEQARKELEKEIPSSEVDSVLELTHCEPPEDYFITSEDMVGKAGVWAHFGSWDFERAKIWSELRGKKQDEAVSIMMKEFNYTQERAQNMYYEVQSIANEKESNNWISPWPGYAGGAGCPVVVNDTIQCAYNLGNQMLPILVDTKSMDAYLETSGGRMHPSSIVYIDKEGVFVKKDYANATIPYALALIGDGESYTSVLMSSELAGSMFTRMFYLDGAGLKHFDKFGHEVDITGQDLITWKVDWEGKD